MTDLPEKDKKRKVETAEYRIYTYSDTEGLCDIAGGGIPALWMYGSNPHIGRYENEERRHDRCVLRSVYISEMFLKPLFFNIRLSTRRYCQRRT